MIVLPPGVPAFFGSEVFPTSVLEQVASESGVDYVGNLSDDKLPGEPGDPNHSYVGMMTENGSILVPSVQFVTEGDRTVVLEKIECAVRPFLENHGDGWTALQWMLDRDPNLLETPLEALRKKRFEAVEAAARAYTCADER